jgi:outer membrane protein assembly factor BamB
VPEADWLTFDANAQRTGVGPGAIGITAANVHHLGLRTVHLNGTVDASPIELRGIRVHGHTRDVVVVTTTYGRTIALDPGTGARLWEFTPSDIRSYQGSSQVTTASPVADPDRRYVYAASPDGRIHKLSLTTGREVRSGGWPARVTFDPTREKIASALNLSGSSVIVVTGGYIGDTPVYQGHVVLLDRAGGRITHVFNSLCSNRTGLIDPPSSCGHSDSAIWARQGAVVEPGSGRLLVATGNADFNGRTDWGDSVLELSPTAALLHNWTPSDERALNDSDQDLGSTAPAVLPRLGGRRLAVQGGKDHQLHVLDLDRLDGTSAGAGARTGGELENLPTPGSAEVLTAPVVWTHSGRTYVFVADDGGTAAYTAHGGAHPGLTEAWHNASSGTSPVLAGGLLYVYDEDAGALNVYFPATGHRVASLKASGGHWNSPIAVGGRVVLPVGSYHDHSTSGELLIWHLAGR